MITVALVDDDPMVRTGLNFILKGEDGIDVAWQASDGAEALTTRRGRLPAQGRRPGPAGRGHPAGGGR